MISYSSPIITEQAKRDVLVVWTDTAVSCLDPQTGKIHWREEIPRQRSPIVPSPVVQGEWMFLTSFYNGSLMFRFPKDRLGVERVWKKVGPGVTQTDAIQPIISTPLMLDGYIYGVDAFGQMRCLEAETGKRVWEGSHHHSAKTFRHHPLRATGGQDLDVQRAR